MAWSASHPLNTAERLQTGLHAGFNGRFYHHRLSSRERMISFVHALIFCMKVFITLGHRIWKMLTAELCFHPNRTNKDTRCSTADAPAEGANRVSLSGE